MTAVSESVLSLAEDLNTHLPLAAGDERRVTPRYVLWLGPTTDPHHNVVQRLRLGPGELPAAVDEARATFAARGRRHATWEVGQHATPGDLAEQLVALGMTPDQPEPVAVGMVLAEALPRSPPCAVFVKRVETLEEYVASCDVVHVCFGAPPELDARGRFELLQAEPHKTRWIALLDGVPVAMADAIHLESATVLSGGATLPEARGRGAYRALLAARSAEAARRAAPVLVTQASSMSRPILRALGFAEVTQVRIFLDAF